MFHARVAQIPTVAIGNKPYGNQIDVGTSGFQGEKLNNVLQAKRYKIVKHQSALSKIKSYINL